MSTIADRWLRTQNVATFYGTDKLANYYCSLEQREYEDNIMNCTHACYLKLDTKVVLSICVPANM